MNGATAISVFTAGVHAVLPSVFMELFIEGREDEIRIGDRWINRSSIGRLVVLAMGKAAAAMALELKNRIGNQVDEALVITKDEHGLATLSWPQREAGHPVPNEASIAAGTAVKNLLTSLKRKDLMIVLLSGGASSLVADLPEGCSLEEMQSFYKLLLASGATINEMNAIRKHYSSIKGGQLARLSGEALIEVGVLSDVPGDELSVIASGPFYPDNSTIAEVEQIIHRYNLFNQLPSSIQAHLNKIKADLRYETPKPGDPVFENITHHLLATNQTALQSAAEAALELGLEPIIFQALIEGEAREEAVLLLGHCLHEMETQTAKGLHPALCFIAGGETTVTLTGKGKGGRNQEFVLAILAACLKDPQLYKRLNAFRFAILSAGTDGTDGPTDAAGAVLDNTILQKVKQNGPDPEPALTNQDAYTYFSTLDALIKTGPTQTNVMDIIIILLQNKEAIPQEE